jgi:MFS family permease
MRRSERPPDASRSSLAPTVAAFVAGVATMVVEIAAARVLAPIMGVSLYSWTAIIGLVLAGLAAGAYVSGFFADRLGATRVLTAGALLSALGGLAALLLADWAPSATIVPTTDVIGRTLWITTAVLAVPSLGLGMVVPPAVRLATVHSADSGRSVGTVYAAATAGNILGVFLTGFLLIDLIGSRLSIAAAGAAMLLVAAAVGRLWVGWPGRLAFLALGVPLALAPTMRSLAGPCTWESAYFCIQIVDEQIIGGRSFRSVKLDRLTHGSIYPDDPTYLDFGYLRVMADLTHALVAERETMRSLQIGGGSYTLARYLEATFPRAEVEVIEIDPKVTRAAETFLGLRPGARVRSYNVDGRQFFIDGGAGAPYHVIYGDAFNDLSIPYHLTTREFAGLLRGALRPDGLYFANVIDLYESGRFLRSFIATLRTQFAHVHLVVDLATYELIGPTAPPGDFARDRRRTFVVVASQQPVDFSRLERVSNGSAFLVDAAQVERYVADPRTIVLTDDYAPVDKLVAPIFLGRPF